jgi:hypothetical protein
MELEAINPEHDTEKCTTKVINTKVFYISNGGTGKQFSDAFFISRKYA